MGVFAVVHFHVQIAQSRRGEPGDKLARQLGVKAADFAAPKRIGLVHEGRTAAEVDRHTCQGFVHGDRGVAVARDPTPIAQRLSHGLPDADPGVFDGVVAVDRNVAARVDLQIDQAVAAEGIKHVAEEGHRRGDFGRAATVQIHGNRDLGFLGISFDLGPAHGPSTMAVGAPEIKPDARVRWQTMWRIAGIGLRLRGVRTLLAILVLASLAGCRVLEYGLGGDAGAADAGDVASDRLAAPADTQMPIEVGELPGAGGPGCSDGTREGFRDYINWPNIAGCAGAFDQPGVVGSTKLLPTCSRLAGDGNLIPDGTGCTAADLCAANWHVCRNGDDVAQSSPSGDCEGCVPAGEPRFFVVATGASSMGVCSPDPQAANDLHGCGGLGQPESQACAPLSRRMGFADCLATNGIWNCGDQSDSLQEAAVVTKSGTTLGGVLCCRD